MNSEPSFNGCTTPSPDLKVLQILLAQVHTQIVSRRTKTFFSIGGRSHWENPASDVLAFFLNPAGEHGFGPLFLEVLFACIGVNTNQLALHDGINSIRTEERLASGERIDLVVRAPNWVLAIENKIRHWAANNFTAYTTHVEQLAAGLNCPAYLALLAPEPISVGHDWRPLTYRDFGAGLLAAFDQSFPALPASTLKWQVFAREFVLHLQTLLYSTPVKLNPEQVNFVESNLVNITTLNSFSAKYVEFLLDELKERLKQAVPERAPFNFKQEPWALTCNGPGSEWRLAFLTPANSHGGNPDRKFAAAICLKFSARQSFYQRARQNLAELQNFQEGGEWWKVFHEDRESAVEDLCRMARAVLGPELV